MYFIVGNPCYILDTTANSVAHLRGMSGYVVGYELMGVDVNLRVFCVYCGDLAHYAPDNRRTIVTTNNILIDELAVQPLHVGSPYMQPFSHSNSDGIRLDHHQRALLSRRPSQAASNEPGLQSPR